MNYQQIAKDARLKVLELIYKAQTSHIGSNFSCIDIMAVLFENIDLDKDKFILSKGWAAASLYYFLWRKNRISNEELNSFCQPGSKFIGLSEPIHRDIPFAGGSMGFGLPAAVGFALAKKIKNEDGKVYVLMSDGEMQCGTTWESIMLAFHHKLNNLVVFIDVNGWQAMGKTKEVLDFELIEDHWKRFGWRTWRLDGHNFEDISFVLKVWLFPKLTEELNKLPAVIICNTVKGKGVSFMENNNLFHYKAPSEEEYNKALKELQL